MRKWQSIKFFVEKFANYFLQLYVCQVFYLQIVLWKEDLMSFISPTAG